MSEPKSKPGIKTTEFGAIATTGATCLTIAAVSSSERVQIAGMIGAVLCAIGYAVARSLAKR